MFQEVRFPPPPSCVSTTTILYHQHSVLSVFLLSDQMVAICEQFHYSLNSTTQRWRFTAPPGRWRRSRSMRQEAGTRRVQRRCGATQ
eukprot:4351043-Pleurochrysis_carterae.AAC.2